MLWAMKTSQNRWTAGNALSWALGVTLGLIVGVALLIAIPRMMSAPSTSAQATSAESTSAESTQPPTAVAQTGDSGGAATTTEQPGATDETGMANGQTSGNSGEGTGSASMTGEGEAAQEGASQGTSDSDTASSTAEATGGSEQGAGTGEDPTQRSSGAAPTPGNMPQDGAADGQESGGAGTAGNAEAGQQFFTGTCAGCHGAEAQGGVGPALGIVKDWSDAEFTTALRQGKTPEKELSPVMPRFTEAQLSGQQVADVHAYLKSLN